MHDSVSQGFLAVGIINIKQLNYKCKLFFPGLKTDEMNIQYIRFVEVCLSCQEDGMFSLRLADKSETFAKRRSLSDEGRLPDQRMPHTIHGVWNLSGGGAGVAGADGSGPFF